MKKTAREARLRDWQRERRARSVAYGFVALVILGLATYLLGKGFTAPLLPYARGNVIDIQADMGGFSVSEVRVKAGEPVTIRLTSLDNQYHTDGGGQHQWAVDEFGVSVIAPPKGANMVTFTPDKPGSYTFYCDICCGGRANPTMQGTLIVEA